MDMKNIFQIFGLMAFPIIALIGSADLGAMAVGQLSQSFANTTVHNESGGPMGLIQIGGSDGEKVAELFVTGKSARFDSDGRICHGSGYVQAEPGKYAHVVFTLRRGKKVGQAMFGVKRVAWDSEGRTTEVRGLSSAVTLLFNGDVPIVSNTDRPQLKDGFMLLRLKGLGEVPFRMRFEQGGSVPEPGVRKLLR
jgi:hypothetical protein